MIEKVHSRQYGSKCNMCLHNYLTWYLHLQCNETSCPNINKVMYYLICLKAIVCFKY